MLETGKFQSSKVFDGFSTVFRQWRAKDTHCRFIHGYGISFKVYFEGDLDERNWVYDFGGMKRSKGNIDGMQPKEWMDYMFDHTIVVAQDDPEIELFKSMNESGLAQVRIIPSVGAERFAEFIFHKLNKLVNEETNGRVRITQVDFREHAKNECTFKEIKI